MTYSLALGNYAYSSWSLRAWLVFEKSGLPRGITHIDLGAPESVTEQLAAFAPARTVPALRNVEGVVLSDSLAITEHLAEAHPETGIWPDDPRQRAIARNLVAEMHSGFQTLRTQCPMNLYCAYQGVPVDEDLRADLDRLETIWNDARERSRSDQPWLCGRYCAADAFYAPVAARIAGYDLPVGEAARSYVDAHLSDLAFRRWRAMAHARGGTLKRYDRDHATRAWPGPVPRVAKAVQADSSENELCPYSGDPVTHFLELDGRVFGFCNAFCRDKTIADPEAWQAFMALLSDPGP